MSRRLEVSLVPSTDEVEIIVNASVVSRNEAFGDMAAPILLLE